MGPIATSQDGRVGRLLLNRPEKRNALNAAMVQDAVAAIGQLERDGATVCVLEAAPPVFSAGADLAEPTEGNPPLELVDAIESSSMLFVASVRGGVLGAGVAVVNACEIVVAAEDAWFSLPEIRLGIFPRFIWDRLIETMGRRHALDLALANGTLDAVTAMARGLVTRVCPAAEVDATARAWAGEIAASASVAIAAKRAWRGEPA